MKSIHTNFLMSKLDKKIRGGEQSFHSQVVRNGKRQSLENRSGECFVGFMHSDHYEGTRHEACRGEVECDQQAILKLLEVARMNVARAKTKTTLRVSHDVHTPRVALINKNLTGS